MSISNCPQFRQQNYVLRISWLSTKTGVHLLRSPWLFLCREAAAKPHHAWLVRLVFWTWGLTWKHEQAHHESCQCWRDRCGGNKKGYALSFFFFVPSIHPRPQGCPVSRWIWKPLRYDIFGPIRKVPSCNGSQDYAGPSEENLSYTESIHTVCRTNVCAAPCIVLCTQAFGTGV